MMENGNANCGMTTDFAMGAIADRWIPEDFGMQSTTETST